MYNTVFVIQGFPSETHFSKVFLYTLHFSIKKPKYDNSKKYDKPKCWGLGTYGRTVV